MRRVPGPQFQPFPSPARPRATIKTFHLFILWIVVNILSEALEEITFFLEPVFAVLQWLALRRYLRRIDGWIFASLAGWLIIVIAFFLGGLAESLNEGLVESGLLASWPTELNLGDITIPTQTLVLKTLLRLIEWTVIGSCQWLALRQAYRPAFGWVFASAIAGLSRGVTGVVCDQALGGLWAVFFAPLVYGLITGIVLLLLQVKTRPPSLRAGY